MKICSLLPSATEIICSLGLVDELAGRTHECDYPQEVASKPVVVTSKIDTSKMSTREVHDAVTSYLSRGEGIYRINENLLREIEPDLLVTQDLCDVCAVSGNELSKAVSKLSKKPVILSLNPHRLDDILSNIKEVGQATGRRPEALELTASLTSRIENIRSTAGWEGRKPKTLCLEWVDPLFIGGHWIPELVSLAGGVDVFGKVGQDSTRIEWEEVRNNPPDVVVVMPCGFDAKKTEGETAKLLRYDGWSDLPAVKNGRVYAVDANSYYSRPGPRVVDGLEIMARIIQPKLFGSSLKPTLAIKV